MRETLGEIALRGHRPHVGFAAAPRGGRSAALASHGGSGPRAVLRSVPDFVVVAEAGDAAEALSLATTLRPDVTLVGLGARGSVVHDLVRALTGLGIRVVLLGEAGAGSDLVDALQAGARG